MYTYFLDFVTISRKVPFLSINSEGNSIFSLYPTLFLLFFLGKVIRSFPDKIRIFLALASVTIVLTLIILLCYFATGWQQFGIRYFLDIAPLAYLMVLFIIERIPKKILIGMLIYEVVINFYGIIVYFYFHT